MGRGRDRGGRARISGPAPGRYPIDSGTAELVQDRDNPAGYLLLINGAQSSHIDLSDPTWLEFEYMRWIAAVIENTVIENVNETTATETTVTAPPAPRPEPMRALHLGAAACALARYLITIRPGSHHLAVDTDAALAALVRAWFDLPKAPALRIRVGDARTVTESLPDASFSVVIRDVFADAVTPEPLMTAEFTMQVKRVLKPGGLYLLNCGDIPGLALTRSEAATVSAVFGSTAIVADPPMLKGRRRGNVIIIGSDAPIGSPGLARELLAGAVPAQLWDDRRVREFARTTPPLHDPVPPIHRTLTGQTPST